MNKNSEIQALTDEELLRKYTLEKDKVLLGQLLTRYIRFVFLIGLKYLHDEEKAKDMAMQVFEKVSTDILRFEIKHFKSWLHIVTKNECLMHLRSQKGFQHIHFDSEKESEKNVENDVFVHHDYDQEKEIKLGQLEKAINSLEEGQKECIALFYIQEKSYKEVADITGLSLNQVKSNIQNGKRNLKSMLINSGEFMLMVFVSLYLKI